MFNIDLFMIIIRLKKYCLDYLIHMHLYQIGKLIGTGSFGQVFSCKHIEQNEFYVAKKLCLAELDDKGKENIENQLKILQAFRHPNIVAFKDSFINQKGLYIIMTYCKGGDLYNRIRSVKEKGKMFPEQQILDWLVEMALAIHYLHFNRILHRDLKSQNIFLEITKDGEKVRLGDFGIAKVMDENQDLTATTAIGSPLYMAPQIFNRNIYSYKSDIWALGCIVYQLCNLRTPFDAQSRHGLMMKVMKGSFPSVTPTYSKQLRDLIAQMLNKKPSKRPTIIQVLQKPFLKYRVQKYVKSILKKNSKYDNFRDRESAIDIQNIKKQIKQLELQLEETNGLAKNSSISSMGQQVFDRQEQERNVFIDHKKSLMIDTQPTEASHWRVARQKKNVILQKIQEQRYNISRFRLIEDYSMDDDQQDIEQNLQQIRQQDEEQEAKRIQQSRSRSRSISLSLENENQVFKSKTYLKIYNQVQVLKNTCQNALGMHRYLKAFQAVQKGATKSEIIEIIGEQDIGYWHMIQQSLFYQSILKQLEQKQ